MKKNFYLLLLMLSAIFFLMLGCVKPVPPTPSMPIVTISADPLTPVYGGTSTINSTYQYVSTVTVNGSANCSFTTGPLFKDTTFTIVAKGPGGTASASVTVKPLPIDLKTKYLTENHWYLVLSEGRVSGDSIWHSFYNECAFSDTLFFYKDFTYKKYETCDPSNPNKVIGSGPWAFEKDGTVLRLGPPKNGGRFYIETLTQEKMVLYYLEPPEYLFSNSVSRDTYYSKKNRKK